LSNILYKLKPPGFERRDAFVWLWPLAARRRVLVSFLSLIIATGAARAQGTGGAPAEPAFEPGDVVVSGFSGTALSTTSLAPGVDPLDKTVIDYGAATSAYGIQIVAAASPGAGVRWQRVATRPRRASTMRGTLAVVSASMVGKRNSPAHLLR
jgi:hypothetical protein